MLKPHILLIILLFCFFRQAHAQIDNFKERIISELEFIHVPIEENDNMNYATSAYMMAEDSSGYMWLASDRGLYRYDGFAAVNVTKQLTEIGQIQLEFDFIEDVAVDENDLIWFGTYTALYKLSKDRLTCEKIPNPDGITTFHIQTIVSHHGLLYIGTENGFFIYDPLFKKYVDRYFTDGVIRASRGTSTIVYNILFENDPNIIWITTAYGLHKINRMDNSIQSYKLKTLVSPPDHYFLPGEKKENEIILPTYKDGLLEFDTETGDFRQNNTPFLKESGPAYNRFKCAVFLKDSLVLFNTEKKGVGIFDRGDRSFHWIEGDKNILRGNYNIHFSKDGYAWIFADDYIYRSNIPLRETVKPGVPPILQINKMELNGQSIIPNSLLKNFPMKWGEDERNVSLSFSLNPPYIDVPHSFQYKWNNKEWVNTDKKLDLFNMKGGKHNLIIRAIDSQGEILSQIEKQWTIYLPYYKKWWFILISLLIIGSVLVVIRRFLKKKEEEKLSIKRDYEHKLMELESTALRSQINPHFIFNTLNSIKYYSIAKTPEETADFLTNFSLLIRQILENSKQNLISLQQEIETISKYIEIENLRFEKSFQYIIDIDPEIAQSQFLIPPMIMQPFVENAIWHGLMHKEDDRILHLIIKQKGEGINVIIRDNGVGRETAAKMKKETKHKSSLGMKITRERIDILNVNLGMNNHYEIHDLVDSSGKATGTEVEIYFGYVNNDPNLKTTKF